jgi:hypothetical protein
MTGRNESRTCEERARGEVIRKEDFTTEHGPIQPKF